MEDATKTSVDSLYIKGLVTREFADDHAGKTVYRVVSKVDFVDGSEGRTGWILKTGARYDNLIIFDKPNREMHRGREYKKGYITSEKTRCWYAEPHLFDYIKEEA